ncbi:MAG: class I SAM-dependent methyltransferase [Planctomycetes bacterium]|nr:class I SAM-dependent methyltransferase [Planctomycetota bacterium]
MHEKILEQNTAYYDQEAAVYDVNRYGTKTGKRAEIFHMKILDCLLLDSLKPHATILELGCGTGRLLEHVASKSFTLYGVDMSSGMLDIARERFEKYPAQKVRLSMGEAGRLDFSDEFFDAVYSILVINLIPDYRQVFCEIAQILKPGGLFVFNVPNLASIYFLGGLFVNLRGQTVTANEVGHRYSHWFLPGEWKNSLENAGFVVEQVLGQPPQVRLVDACTPLRASGWGLPLSKSVYIKARLKHD